MRYVRVGKNSIRTTKFSFYFLAKASGANFQFISALSKWRGWGPPNPLPGHVPAKLSNPEVKIGGGVTSEQGSWNCIYSGLTDETQESSTKIRPEGSQVEQFNYNFVLPNNPPLITVSHKKQLR